MTNEHDDTSEMDTHILSDIEITSPVPEGCIPVKALEVVIFLNTEGKEEIGVRWQGSNNIVQELGMIEYAKIVMLDERDA